MERNDGPTKMNRRKMLGVLGGGLVGGLASLSALPQISSASPSEDLVYAVTSDYEWNATNTYEYNLAEDTVVWDRGDSNDASMMHAVLGPDGEMLFTADDENQEVWAFHTSMSSSGQGGDNEWVVQNTDEGGTTRSPASLSVSYDGSMLFVGDDRGITALDTADGSRIWRRDTDWSETSYGNEAVVVGPDDEVVYAAGYAGFIGAIDAESGGLIWSDTDSVDIRAADIVGDGGVLLLGNDSGELIGWETDDGGELWRSSLFGSSEYVQSISTNSDEDAVYIGTDTDVIGRYDLDIQNGIQGTVWEDNISLTSVTSYYLDFVALHGNEEVVYVGTGDALEERDVSDGSVLDTVTHSTRVYGVATGHKFMNLIDPEEGLWYNPETLITNQHTGETNMIAGTSRERQPGDQDISDEVRITIRQ